MVDFPAAYVWLPEGTWVFGGDIMGIWTMKYGRLTDKFDDNPQHIGSTNPLWPLWSSTNRGFEHCWSGFRDVRSMWTLSLEVTGFNMFQHSTMYVPEISSDGSCSPVKGPFWGYHIFGRLRNEIRCTTCLQYSVYIYINMYSIVLVLVLVFSI